jgi:hypothetical protein
MSVLQKHLKRPPVQVYEQVYELYIKLLNSTASTIAKAVMNRVYRLTVATLSIKFRNVFFPSCADQGCQMV